MTVSVANALAAAKMRVVPAGRGCTLSVIARGLARFARIDKRAAAAGPRAAQASPKAGNDRRPGRPPQRVRAPRNYLLCCALAACPIKPAGGAGAFGSTGFG